MIEPIAHVPGKGAGPFPDRLLAVGYWVAVGADDWQSADATAGAATQCDSRSAGSCSRKRGINEHWVHRIAQAPHLERPAESGQVGAAARGGVKLDRIRASLQKNKNGAQRLAAVGHQGEDLLVV